MRSHLVPDTYRILESLDAFKELWSRPGEWEKVNLMREKMNLWIVWLRLAWLEQSKGYF